MADFQNEVELKRLIYIANIAQITENNSTLEENLRRIAMQSEMNSAID